MSYRSVVKILLPVLFPAFLFAQERTTLATLSTPLKRPVQDSAEQNFVRDKKDWVEDIAARTVYSSSYKTPEGKIILRYSKLPINYPDASGALQPINFHPKTSSDGWAATAQPYPTYLYNDGSAAVSTAENLKFIFGKNVSVNGNPVPLRVPVMNASGEMAKIANIIPGMDKEYGFKLDGVKYNYVLNQPVATVNGFLTISEELEIPSGYFLKRSEERGREQDGGWSGDFQLIAPDGEVAATILAPICFDASKKITIGTYKLKNENGHQFLELLVPASWLNDASRSYPVTIDPLIIGPTAFYGNTAQPSCFFPAFFSDSILVTIPGQIAITGLIVTGSYYADPFGPAVMSQGDLWFSTPCSQSQTFTVAPPAGDTAGTGFLDTFNLRNPLMCCYPQSCSQRTFYLSMHLSRTTPLTSGCNQTYVRYDPLFSFPSFPFEAYVEGRTVEAYGQKFAVQTAPICSDVCTFTATVYVRYGVPPYTISHPWMSTNVVVGTPLGCSYGNTNTMITLTRPICPTSCDTITLLSVPAPTVTDACGNTAAGMPIKFLHLKSKPELIPVSDTVCSGDPFFVSLASCHPTSTTTWSGNSISGNGNIYDVLINSGSNPTTTTYTATTTLNGCTSDTLTIPVVVDPDPVASFANADPIIVGIPTGFSNNSGTGSLFGWSFGDTTFSSLENPVHTYNHAGTYQVCFVLTTNLGCSDTVCKIIDVIPAAIELPNVITPNADGTNDFLVFKYLEYFKNNHLDIFDRWGSLLYSKDSYANDWDGSKYTDGTYYYILTTKDDSKQYSGFFEILK